MGRGLSPVGRGGAVHSFWSKPWMDKVKREGKLIIDEAGWFIEAIIAQTNPRRGVANPQPSPPRLASQPSKARLGSRSPPTTEVQAR